MERLKRFIHLYFDYVGAASATFLAAVALVAFGVNASRRDYLILALGGTIVFSAITWVVVRWRDRKVRREPKHQTHQADVARWRSALLILHDVLRFTPILLYFFFYWNFKDRLRSLFRVGAVGFLSLTVLLLWLEIVGEAVIAFKTTDTTFRFVAFVIFSTAVVIVLIQHAHDRRDRYRMSRMTDLVFEVGALRTLKRDVDIEDLLRPIHETFVPLGAKATELLFGERVEASIRFSYPLRQSSATSLVGLEGLQDLVLTDRRPRYVPRSRHAVVFELRRSGSTIDLVRPKLDLDVFPADTDEQFKAVVVVPSRLTAAGRSGLLTITFDRTDPLSRSDIKHLIELAALVSAREV